MLSPLAAVPSNDHLILIGLAVVGIMAIIPAINGAMNIWQRVKGQGPNPPLHSYALRSELADEISKVELRVNTRIASELVSIHRIMGEQEKQLENLSRDFLKEVKEINRSIGTLEGRVK